MFIGRKDELRVLDETCSKSGFQMTVIYGRRRIGKSTLIAEFIKDKRSSYYVADQSGAETNLANWANQVIEDLMPDMTGAVFKDYNTFFKFLSKNSGDERTIIALDEIPYLAESDTAFLSILQKAIDQFFVNTNIYLIICGSAVSFMEKTILSEKSPLFGRRSNQIFLKPFDYITSAEFVPAYTYEEKAIVYGVTGGVAKYLELFDDKLSLDENLISLFFRPSGYLYEEPYNLLTQEFRTIGNYHRVIEVCASGTTKFNEIADKSHISGASLNYLLKNLITVGILSKISPMTDEHNKKKTRYELEDGLYSFWYKFVPQARAAIELKKGDVFYYKNVRNRLHEYMTGVFEKMSRHYTLIKGLCGELKCVPVRTGSWWGSDMLLGTTDIDVVALDDADKKAVIGECKFKNEVLDKEIYLKLREKTRLIDKRYEVAQYIYFSLAGFSDWVKNNKDQKMDYLVSIEAMYQK